MRVLCGATRRAGAAGEVGIVGCAAGSQGPGGEGVARSVFGMRASVAVAPARDVGAHLGCGNSVEEGRATKETTAG